MKKLLAAIVAGMFALSTAPAVLAAKHEMKKEEMKKEEMKKDAKKQDPVAVACKGKKPGDEVTVDKKKVKCPAPKTATTKPEPKK